ncbi:hypothetical protein SARC_07309 [Sphaeroforma arctica JP610]|uniref:YjeF N-terminal domain-containing protein n=1 Tax=Sphaeroforma arctica JP610 TaxID=667725 RepID=A0A0L0FUJ1_9EUKA|nr:hypothetical protein SARC_07309 [Sphaeroforma arctica JP610]KNC80334.1 hypothetical protein SARC_07309 [Sphaeroforma arctica JP610]|eukprot:XP_014154236.1 hypothetical protein SARC_07309 [Sphaeroforma arctica JP610]
MSQLHVHYRRVRLPLNQFATSHSPNKGRGRGRGRGRQRDRDTDNSLGDVAVDLVVDGICGIELDAAPSDLATELMDWAETCDANVISIDLPSGMNGDTGEYYDPSKIITPRWIVALGLPVGGLRSTECEARFLADIGIPAAAFENAGIDGYSVQTFGDKYVIPITLTNSNEQ